VPETIDSQVAEDVQPATYPGLHAAREADA